MIAFSRFWPFCFNNQTTSVFPFVLLRFLECNVCSLMIFVRYFSNRPVNRSKPFDFVRFPYECAIVDIYPGIGIEW